MSDRPLKLLLVDQDPIFRLGLRVSLEAIPHLQVVAEAETDTATLQILAELATQDSKPVDLVVLELSNNRSSSSQQQGLQLCRQLKALYPYLPILLFTSLQEAELLSAAKGLGVDGYCPKGTPLSELVTAIEAISSGQIYWFGNSKRVNINPSILSISPSRQLPLARLRHNLRSSGIENIDAALAEVNTQLQTPGVPILDRAVLAGQRRELLAARWLLNHLLASPRERQQQRQQFTCVTPAPLIPPPNSTIEQLDTQQQPSAFLLSPRALQSALFATCVSKLQFSLQNVTDIPLEIDIFREEKKRELLYLILQKLAQQLDDLRSSQVTIDQLEELKSRILVDLWQAAITDFFGKFSLVRIGTQNQEIVQLLLENIRVIQREIFNKIPLVSELIAYLVFKTDLYIDNASYPAGSSEAQLQALNILENLLIEVANAVVQPLLNSLADVEVIKQNFYDRKLISTREIERFRNDLSWKYRLRNLINEPTAIFESRYELFVFAPRGIAKTSIYAHRGQELARLSGIPLAVTLILEFRDAIAPRLRSLLSFAGSGIVFILTQVIGRGLGLIGRGIIQGIGSISLTEKNMKRNSERPK